MRSYAKTAATVYLFAIGAVLSSCATSSSEPTKAKLSPTDKAKQLVAVANGAVVENDPTGALQFLQQAEALDRKLPEVHHVKALALFQRQELNAAIAAATEAVRLKPDYAEASNTLGRLLIEAGRNAEAIPHLERAANNLIFRESYKADINLGILYYRGQKLDLAKKYFEHAIMVAPQFTCLAQYYRAHIALQEGEVNQAITGYEKASQRSCARFSDAHLALGVAYVRGRQFDKARKKFLDIYKIFPNTDIAQRAMEEIRKLP